MAQSPTSATNSETEEAESEAPPGSFSKAGSSREEFRSEDPRTDWQTYFPYDTPREAQSDGIPKVVETLDDEGFALMEAACGSGKTLIALCSALSLVRDRSTQFKRVLCLTSVKQQVRAFEDDLETINEHLDDDTPAVSSITAVGKADLCAHTDAGTVDERDIYQTCEDARDPVRMSINAAQSGQQAAQSFVDDAMTETDDPTPIETSEWTAPYSDDFQDGRPACAFYARYRAEVMNDDSGYAPKGVLTAERLRRQAASKGLCPHAVMGNALDDAEVVVGNYYHAFDPMTVEALTGPLIDRETIVVLDEAHMTVPKVRDLLSDTLSQFRLQQAIDECEWLLEAEKSGPEKTIWSRLSRNGVDEDDVEEFQQFLADAEQFLVDEATSKLDGHTDDWQDKSWGERPDEVEKQLRNPEKPQPDRFSRWVDEQGHTDLFVKARELTTAIEDAIGDAEDEHRGFTRPTIHTKPVGRVLSRWSECDHEAYFRTIEIEKRRRKYDEGESAAEQTYRLRFKLHNCLPAEEIAARLDHFGGGILMSATLAPLDAYRRTVGIESLAEDGRTIRELVYGLPFPRENRLSRAVKVPKFTHNNRGYPTTDSEGMTDVREQYADLIVDVAQEADGNVLVAMPSYDEAKWAANVLKRERTVTKPILVDESSSNDVTEELKQRFFEGDGKVLTTGLRGTLTEGVDYDGDRLEATVVCGVPIRNTRGAVPTAIKTAYEREFGQNNGFEYAFTVPAVRKTRQALGRVIRGHDEVGIRVVADRRYAHSYKWDDVRGLLPEYERRDYSPVDPSELRLDIEAFFDRV